VNAPSSVGRVPVNCRLLKSSEVMARPVAVVAHDDGSIGGPIREHVILPGGSCAQSPADRAHSVILPCSDGSDDDVDGDEDAEAESEYDAEADTDEDTDDETDEDADDESDAERDAHSCRVPHVGIISACCVTDMSQLFNVNKVAGNSFVPAGPQSG
jgi:hypothetical protein